MILRVAAAQYPLTKMSTWTEWVQHTEHWIDQAVQAKAQLLVFPEYGSMELVSLLPLDQQNSLPVQIQGMGVFQKEFLQFFQQQAQAQGVAILAPSFPLYAEGFTKPVNRAFFCFPDGRMDYQDKVYMTRFENEQWGVGAGETQEKVFEAFGVKIGVNICFDVEFPFSAHRLARQGVQILLAPSCTESLWGLNRVHVGARARAMENQFYVVIAQTVGEARWSSAVDLNTGRAAFYSTCDHGFPADGLLAEGELNAPSWVYCDLDLSLLEEVRRDGHVLNYQTMLRAR
ncbi:MAG: carbon-nitrogen hydrolase family protein [Bdellovibrio sp.]